MYKMPNMSKLNSNIDEMLEKLGGKDVQSRKVRRTFQVYDRYKDVIEVIYKENAPLMLKHTNSVFIFNKDGVKTLAVYVDESIFAAELNAQREMVRLKLLEMFKEKVDQFDIHISRGKYKLQHPYDVENLEMTSRKLDVKPLEEAQESYVEQTISVVDNPVLRDRIKKAMTADLQWKNAISDKLPENSQNSALN